MHNSAVIILATAMAFGRSEHVVQQLSFVILMSAPFFNLMLLNPWFLLFLFFFIYNKKVNWLLILVDCLIQRFIHDLIQRLSAGFLLLCKLFKRACYSIMSCKLSRSHKKCGNRWFTLREFDFNSFDSCFGLCHS